MEKYIGIITIITIIVVYILYDNNTIINNFVDVNQNDLKTEVIAKLKTCYGADVVTKGIDIPGSANMTADQKKAALITKINECMDRAPSPTPAPSRPATASPTPAPSRPATASPTPAPTQSATASPTPAPTQPPTPPTQNLNAGRTLAGSQSSQQLAGLPSAATQSYQRESSQLPSAATQSPNYQTQQSTTDETASDLIKGRYIAAPY